MVYDLSEYSGKSLDYVTEEQPHSGIFVKAKVTSRWIEKAGEGAGGDGDASVALATFLQAYFQSSEGSCDSEGSSAYTWIGIDSLLTLEKPCCWVLSYEDFYTLEQYDDRNVMCGAGEGFNYKKAEFSLTYNGTVYDKCRMLLLIHNPAEEGTRIKLYYRIPAGYDGCVLGFHNSAALTQKQLEAGMADPAACLGLIERTEGDLYIRLK